MDSKQPEQSPYLPKSKLRHFVNQFKTQCAYKVFKNQILKYRPSYQHESFKLVDTGCGPGYFLNYIKQCFPKAKLHGVDLNNSLLEFSTDFVEGIDLKISNAESLPFPDEHFDVVSCLQVIEHLEHPENFFSEAWRILKPNGLLMITTPNLNGFPAKIMGDKWSGFRYDHIALKTPQAWREIIQPSFKILNDGSTFLTGIPLFRILPFALFNWIPLYCFGYFSWLKGESYIAFCEKGKKN